MGIVVKMVLNETIFQNEALGDWRESYTVDWWTCLITSVLILVQSLYWLNSTFGGIGTIQDLLCGLAEATTEAAVFFSNWTFLPYISMSFCVISALNGIVGIIGISLQNEHITTAAWIMGAVSMIFALVLLIIFSFLSCCYSCCRCCGEKAAKTAYKGAKSAASTTKAAATALMNSNKDENLSMDNLGDMDDLENPKEKKEKIKHSYCWNFFSHFAIPIFVFMVLYSIFLTRAFKFGNFWFW